MDYPDITGTGLDRAARDNFAGIDDIIPDLLHLLPRCDENVTIRMAIAEAAQQFCRDTDVFKVKSNRIDAVADQLTYDITTNYPAEIKTVPQVKVYTGDDSDSAATLAQTLTGANFEIEDWLEEVTLVLPVAISIPTDEVAVLVADLVLIPTLDEMWGSYASAFPQPFLRRWRAAFAAGALASLAAMNGKPWHNPSLAQEKFMQYHSLKEEAIAKNMMGMKSGGLSCRNPEPWI